VQTYWYQFRRRYIDPKPRAPRTAPDLRRDLAVAHAVIACFGVGIFVSALIWYLRKNESRYAAYQSAQAALWQAAYLLLLIAVGEIMGRILLVAFFGALLTGDNTALTTATLCYRALQVLLTVPFVILGLYAALLTWTGHDFHYPVISRWVN
jgi:uncharacterized Tic20 family protein